MSMQDLNRNKQNQTRFEELMRQVNREGKEELLKYIKKETDFFTAPASTNFHLACEGGLLQHSLNVYDCLMLKKQNPVWEPILRDVPQESLIIVSLLHDLCKANFYVKTTRNVKTYEPEKVTAAPSRQVKHDDMGDFIWETVPGYRIEDSFPIGHGEKSLVLILEKMWLKKVKCWRFVGIWSSRKRSPHIVQLGKRWRCIRLYWHSMRQIWRLQSCSRMFPEINCLPKW